MSNFNRTKGHDLERQVTRDLKNFFPYATTSRASSRQLDNCGIDINKIPFLIQCKNTKKIPKFLEEYENIKNNIKINFSQDDIIHTLPIIVIHKTTPGKGNRLEEKHLTVTMSYDYFLHILSNMNLNSLNSL